MAQRRSLEETWSHLGSEMPRDTLGKPFVPTTMPSWDDDVLGFSFFRQVVEDSDLSDLALPRTYFGRSGLERVSFRNTDLSESRMCWTDFIDCDFSGADLTGCDMRASVYENCRFVGAILRGANFCHSSFEGCDFTGADLAGTIASEAEGIAHLLSDEQHESMIWHDEPGEEPPGG